MTRATDPPAGGLRIPKWWAHCLARRCRCVYRSHQPTLCHSPLPSSRPRISRVENQTVGPAVTPTKPLEIVSRV